MLALGVWTVSTPPVWSQTTIEPAAPRWGESITVTLSPNRRTSENQRVEPGEQVFAVLSPTQKGPVTPRD